MVEFLVLLFPSLTQTLRMLAMYLLSLYNREPQPTIARTGFGLGGIDHKI